MKKIIVSFALVTTLMMGVLPVSANVGDQLPSVQADPYLGDVD